MSKGTNAGKTPCTSRELPGKRPILLFGHLLVDAISLAAVRASSSIVKGSPMNSRLEQLVERSPEVQKVGSKVSQALHKAVLSSPPAVRSGVDALHGVWLGHPLHPVFTDVTIGAWTAAGMFDTIAMLTDSKRAAWTGDRLVELGTLSAVPTALSGLADFSTIPQPAAKPATLHAMFNIVGVGLNLVSIIARRGGQPGVGRSLSLTALGLTTVSGWLGGMLVYKERVGPDQSEQFYGPKNWKAVIEDADLPEGTPKRVRVSGKSVMLWREKGEIYAIGSVCSHAGGPLHKGKVEDGCVTCPWHDSVFDLRDGSVVHGPATRPQPHFETRVHDQQIEIRLVPTP